MRIFIAVELPAFIKIEIVKLQQNLKRQTTHGSFVPIENFHITLKFIGEIDDKQLAGLYQAMESITNILPSFHLSIGSIGYFGNLPRLRVVWIGINGELSYLRLLQKTIESALLVYDFPKEKGMYCPHITIARNVDMCKDFLQQEILIPSFLVQKFCIMQSTRQNNRQIYTKLQEFQLTL